MHINKYSTLPLYMFHMKNKVSNMLKASTALHNTSTSSSPPPELWLQCLHSDSLRVGGFYPTVVTSQGGCSTFIQLGKPLWGTSTFVCSSCCTLGAVSSSAGLQTVSTGWLGPLKGSQAGAVPLVVTSVGAGFSAGPLHWKYW